MGAETFTSIVKGEADVSKAFATAVSQAQYDYGHAGYTGTIAEKDGYVVIGSVQESQQDAEDKADKLIERDDSRISDKWGPAGAIKFTEDGEPGWVFFGWASS